MKKFISTLVVVAMLLSMLTVATTINVAAEGEGEWGIYATAKSYKEGYDGETIAPLPGYSYTPDGFKTIMPEYSNSSSPWFTIATKEKQDIQAAEGISMTVRVDAFDTMKEGATAPEDNWLSFSIWSQPTISQADGDPYCGYGFTTLLRDNTGDGKVDEVQGFLQDNAKGMAFPNQHHVTGAAVVTDNADGTYNIDMKVKYVDGKYQITVCGVLMPEVISEYLVKTFTDGQAHISITLNNSKPAGASGLTITEFCGGKPQGTDSKEAEIDNNSFGPMIDSDQIADGQPALIVGLGASESAKIEPGSGVDVKLNDDGSIHATATSASCYFSMVSYKDYSYEAKDFPVIAIMMKNYRGSTGNVFYCAGDVLKPNNKAMTNWELDDYAWDKDDVHEYEWAYIDLSDAADGEAPWSGRINSVRIGFDKIGLENEGENEWDIPFIACFRTMEDAEAYVGAYLKTVGVNSDDSAGDDATTEKPAEDTTEGSTTTAETTEDTTENTDVTTEADTTATEEKGCKSAFGIGAIAIAVVAVGALAFRKKEN